MSKVELDQDRFALPAGTEHLALVAALGQPADHARASRLRGAVLLEHEGGTTAGGLIPDPKRQPNQPLLRSTLNRAELTRLATAGGGRYYEIDREGDRDIANALIEQTRRRAGTTGVQEDVAGAVLELPAGRGGADCPGRAVPARPCGPALQLSATAVLVFVSSGSA